MARPRKGVTFDNADYIFNYVNSANVERRLGDVLQSQDLLMEAITQLDQLPEVGYCLLTDLAEDNLSAARMGVDPYALENWVVEFISPLGWQKILTAYRQYRHTRKHLKTSLKLEQDVYWRFSHFARTKSLSLEKALSYLLDNHK